MAKYRVFALDTVYWKPKQDYLEIIVEAIKKNVVGGNFLVVSEKAISTSMGHIVDESRVKPSLGAELIASLWMRVIWGYFLGVLCHFHPQLLLRLRAYPTFLGSRHKQVALERAGLLQALMFGSEGGIDGSNLPYSYVSLPLDDVDTVAREIREQIWLRLGKKVCVIIVDTDRTYSFGNFHFTPRLKPLKGIHSFDGIVAYVVGRALRLRRRATPLGVAGCTLSAETGLRIADIANRVRGAGAGRTVWEMSEKFGVNLNGVSWEMLATVKHKPIVIIGFER